MKRNPYNVDRYDHYVVEEEAPLQSGCLLI